MYFCSLGQNFDTKNILALDKKDFVTAEGRDIRLALILFFISKFSICLIHVPHDHGPSDQKNSVANNESTKCIETTFFIQIQNLGGRANKTIPNTANPNYLCMHIHDADLWLLNKNWGEIL